MYKYLGIYLDSHLNFNKHIDYVRKITSHKIFTLSKIRRFIDEYTATHIYKTMISPIFDYGDVIYEGGNKGRLDKLQRIQNRGLRIFLGVQGYMYRGITLWNSLTIQERNINSDIEYKKFQYRWRIDVTNNII